MVLAQNHLSNVRRLATSKLFLLHWWMRANALRACSIRQIDSILARPRPAPKNAWVRFLLNLRRLRNRQWDASSGLEGMKRMELMLHYRCGLRSMPARNNYAAGAINTEKEQCGLAGRCLRFGFAAFDRQLTEMT